MSLHRHIQETISTTTGREFTVVRSHAVSGGCINPAFCLEGHGQRYFVKTNTANRLAMFEAEAAGLIVLSPAIRTPQPIASGVCNDMAWLALEWLELDQPGDMAAMGHALANVHRINAPLFGWHRDNTLGITRQNNAWREDWIHFWRDCRLGYQFQLACQNGYTFDNWELLLEKLPVFFQGYTPQPSLLHGDLWSGNASFTRGGVPVLYDPACYFGDREADIATTELFGGFSPRFLAAYQLDWPLDPGYRVRSELYKLYHILNHLNLFGGRYAPQAERMLAHLVAHL